MVANNGKDLGDALRREEPYIELEEKLAAQVKKLIRLNAALWIFCLAALSVAAVAVMQMPATAGLSGIASLAAGTSASAVIGVDTAVTAVTIAVAGGNIGTLNVLRRYRLEEKKNGKIILYLKK
ncbi:MAG: hypothetical protein HFH36_14075 [Lachnospiraceae bacterium]|nr:hypothetical protein [Lachnospiraceae bacterium]MCI9448460.1 hypothetical protein [Lachnospiraceae bacterium]